MVKQKNITFGELTIIFFIIIILFSTVLVTYLDYMKNYNVRLTKKNHYTILSIIESENYECSKESNQWIWNNTVTIICGSNFIDNQIDKFFNDVINLKNPYDGKKAVYEISSIPDVFKAGINYIMLNKDTNSLKITTLTEYNGKFLEVEKHFK